MRVVREIAKVDEMDIQDSRFHRAPHERLSER
jgi:hypothetical protein